MVMVEAGRMTTAQKEFADTVSKLGDQIDNILDGYTGAEGIATLATLLIGQLELEHYERLLLLEELKFLVRSLVNTVPEVSVQ